MTIEITDPGIRLQLLSLLIHKVDHGGVDDLIRKGVRSDLLDQIRHRNVRDLQHVSNDSAVALGFTLDQDSVLSLLTRLDGIRKHEVRYEYFVRHGATVQFVCSQFRKSAEDVRSLRAQLLASDELVGDKRMPPSETRDEIHCRWHEIRDEHPDALLRDCIYELHQSFPQFRIDALCRTLNEFTRESSWMTLDS